MDEANNSLQRTIPQNIEAEKSVLGAMLMDRDAIEAAVGIITAGDFYSKRYGIMFEAIKKVYSSITEDIKEGTVDLVTVQEQLAKDGAPAEMLSLDFIREIYDASPTSINVRQYANIVHDKAVQRRLIGACADISQLCYDDNENTETILQEAEKRIFDICKKGGTKELTPIEDISLDVFKRIQEASHSKDHITGISTGFTELDNMTAGLQPSDLILIAARPSMGKTAFVLNILEHVAIKKNRPCMVFSLEMSKEQLVQRLYAMDSGIDAQSLRMGKIGDSEWDRLLDTADRIACSNIHIDDTSALSVADMRSRCRKLKLEKGLDLIIIDYLQLMSGSSKKNDNRQQEVSEISRSLKGLAREMNCPVVALSQLSRAPELRTDKRPMLSDLRESGSIEQDADVVMFIYRDEYYNKDSERKGEAEINIAKQRNGSIGPVYLYWKAETTRFLNKERVHGS